MAKGQREERVAGARYLAVSLFAQQVDVFVKLLVMWCPKQGRRKQGDSLASGTTSLRHHMHAAAFRPADRSDEPII